MQNASAGAVDTIKSWLTECNNDHDECKSREFTSTMHDDVRQHRMPKRLVRIDGEAEQLKIRLEDDFSDREAYAALSYCWGSAEVLKTTHKSYGALKAQIPVSELPGTIHDAIEICWRIGIRLLWIDSLCIVQDDIDDWKHESPNMDSIYSGAYLTIVAAASGSATGGCFPHRPHPKDCFRLPISSKSQAKPLLVDIEPFPVRAGEWTFEDEPIQKRGWALQERLLSRRMLHCSAYEFFWICAQCWESDMATEHEKHHEEDDMKADQLLLQPSYWSPVAAVNAWSHCIQNYSRRTLSFAKDKLPAIQGLVRAIKPSIPGAYSYGIWEVTLPFSLCWHYTERWGHEIDADGCPTDVKPFGVGPETKGKFGPVAGRAPSWSWASVDGYVSHPLAGIAEVGERNDDIVIEENSVHGEKSAKNEVTDMGFKRLKSLGVPVGRSNSESYKIFEACYDLMTIATPCNLTYCMNEIARICQCHAVFTESETDCDASSATLPSITLTCRMIDVRLVLGQEVSKNLKDDNYDDGNWHWVSAQGDPLTLHSVMDDRAFPHKDSTEMEYTLALIMQEQIWLILALNPANGQYRRVGVVLVYVKAILVEIDDESETDESASESWESEYDSLVSQSSTRTILLC